MIDVRKLLDDHGVHYVESGSNVAKGNINIKCPWCGVEDKSEHLGINLRTSAWGCWRSASHRGRKLSRLLVKLLGVSPQEARRLAGEGRHIAVQRGDYDRALLDLSSSPVDSTDAPHSRHAVLDPYMHRLTGRTRSQRRAVKYLVRDRGFPREDIRRLCKRYDLHFAIRGDYANRIVIPVYEDGKLMTYLGRSIYNSAGLRYRALEKEKSVKQVKDCLYNFDNANRRGAILYLVEGAIDVWKVDFYNYSAGVRAIGLFNMNLEPAQLEQLIRLRDLYQSFVILLDSGQVAESFVLESQLSALLPGLTVQHLHIAGDPGELTPRQAMTLRYGGNK